MTSRCHLCGRSGSRGFVEANVALLGFPRAERRRLGLVLTDHVTICAARRACNQRRGVPA